MIKTTEEELGFRPLIDPNSKFKPVKQIFSGYEIEKRQLLFTHEEDFTRRKNGLVLYNEVLTNGVLIEQGYVKDIPQAAEMLNTLGINLNDFKPNTIRFRRFGEGYKDKEISPYRYVLTLKNNKDTKKREAEFKLSRAQFEEFWADTKGARVLKKRLKKTIKNFVFEIDAFCDRLLLIGETEVMKEDDLLLVPKMGHDITGDKNFTNKALSR